MDTSSISSYLSSYSDIYSSSDKTSSVSKSTAKDYSKATDEELMNVCKEFEAYFVEQTFKAMEKMIPDNEDEDSGSGASTLNMFKDNLIQEYASSATDGEGLGLAQMLFEQMKRNYNL